MTQDDNGVAIRYVVELEEGWQFAGGEFKSLWTARIYVMPLTPQWPPRRQHPTIVLADKRYMREQPPKPSEITVPRKGWAA